MFTTYFNRKAAPFCLLIGCALQSGLGAEDQARRQPVRINGTFLQLLSEHNQWPQSRWSELFGYFQQLGLRFLILQWSVIDDTAFYPSDRFKSATTSTIEAVLKEADDHGISVRLGLIQDSDYWTRIAGDTVSVKTYLDSVRVRSLTAAQELAKLMTGHKSLAGWYIPQEVDDVTWRDRQTREALTEGVSSIVVGLRKLTPKLTISISAFAQGQASPKGFEEFWSNFFASTKLDCVLFQDGVGVNKLQISEVPLYMSALKQAATKAGRRADVVVELLEQTSGPPIDEKAFHAKPATMERIERQLKSIEQFGPEEVIGFSVPEYMTPLGGPQAAELYERYRDYLNGSPAPAAVNKNK
ncbi:MAG: DUF4434 domain-containing protein [Bryobacteraceae bacterium]